MRHPDISDGSARRRLLRSMLTGIPWIGESWLLPKVVGYYEKGPMWPWYLRRFAGREARRINRAIDAGAKHMYLVYDCGVCPLTYGDYLNFVMIMRYLGERGLQGTLYILDSDIFPAFRAYMSDEEIEGFLQEMIEIGRTLLPYPEVRAQRVNDIQEVMQLAGSQAAYVVCPWRTRHRRELFHHVFNIFNHLMASTPAKLQDRILLSFSDLKHVAPSAEVPSPYIAWHVRYSMNTDPARNLTTEEFVGVHQILRRQHPDHAILIVSDDVGCRHYSKLVREHCLDRTVLSKDYSISFLGDAALILQSDMYYVLRGGGISIIPLMSKLPFRCALRIYYNQMWNSEQFMSWQGRTQRIVNEVDFELARVVLMS